MILVQKSCDERKHKRMIEQDEKAAKINNRTPRRAVLAVAAVCALAGASGFALIVRAQLPAAANVSVTPESERVLITVEGMHCGTCASGIKSMLKRTPGVRSAEVDFEQKQASVEFDPTVTSREKILEA